MHLDSDQPRTIGGGAVLAFEVEFLEEFSTISDRDIHCIRRVLETHSLFRVEIEILRRSCDRRNRCLRNHEFDRLWRSGDHRNVDRHLQMILEVDKHQPVSPVSSKIGPSSARRTPGITVSRPPVSFLKP